VQAQAAETITIDDTDRVLPTPPPAGASAGWSMHTSMHALLWQLRTPTHS
jgi:hypothetical protein